MHGLDMQVSGYVIKEIKTPGLDPAEALFSSLPNKEIVEDQRGSRGI